MAEMKKMLTVDIEDLNLFGNKHKLFFFTLFNYVA